MAVNASGKLSLVGGVLMRALLRLRLSSRKRSIHSAFARLHRVFLQLKKIVIISFPFITIQRVLNV